MILVIVSQRLKIPSIVLLFIGGVVVGPEVLGWVVPDSLEGGLETLIALSVAIILFEGGLTLDLSGYRRAPVVIKRMLVVGSLVTWFGTSAAVFLLFGLAPALALMAGSLVIVTGPTVIAPILRRIHVKERIHHILYWEAVFVDAIGVFVAVLCYEWLVPDIADPRWHPLGRFALRILVGVGVGACVGFVVSKVLKRSWVPDEYVNIFVLACALLTFGVAHVFLTESGILAVVVAGLVVGLQRPPQITRIKRFKLQLTELGIGAVFVLLAAKLELDQFTGWRLVALVGIVILVLRPIAVWLSTWGQKFGVREKLFLSWIAPRGIVAAAMASLFSVRLQELGYADAKYLETFTYAVIATTVTLQGLSAPWVARLLGLERSDRRTWVLVGDKSLVAALVGGLRRAGVKVVEVADSALTTGDPGPDDPRFSDTQAVLCAGTTMLQNVWTQYRLGFGLRTEECFRWATFEGDAEAQDDSDDLAAHAVWARATSAAVVVQGLKDGSHIIEVVEVDDPSQVGRFGNALQPLFWVDAGRAQIVSDPLDPGPPLGDLAVVLRRRVPALAGLVADVELIDDQAATFDAVLGKLMQTVARLHPDLPIDALTRGIQDRRQTMPAAIGGGIAVPHGYCQGLERSRCFLAVVPGGVVDMIAPDEFPVRLVFLLVSPLGEARQHLESLAALASLGQDLEFIDLLCRQSVPDRVSRLISERE